MSNSLFVARLAKTVTYENLRALFEEVGTVLSVRRPKDFTTGEPRSFAFVVMATPELAAQAIKQLNGRVVEGTDIAVMYNNRNELTTVVRSKADGEAQALSWDDRLDMMLPSVAQPGNASSAVITLVGRPGRIVVHDDVTMIALQHTPNFNRFVPKGVPQPPDTTVLYTVYISAKLWKKVSASIQSPEDLLMVDGNCFVDVEAGSIAVIATRVTTKLLDQAARRKAQTYTETTDAEPQGPEQQD